MSAESVICLVIFCGVSALMIGIGISQLRSKKPVGFYSGETPPAESELTNVQEWNQKHGVMWILYGVIIMISYGICMWVGDSVFCVIPLMAGMLIPVVFMIRYHRRLREKYLK